MANGGGRVSQPSIHLPSSVYKPSFQTGAYGLIRFYFRREKIVVGKHHRAAEFLGREIDQLGKVAHSYSGVRVAS